MTMFLINTADNAITVAKAVPEDFVPSPPWRVVSREELDTLREQYEGDPVPPSISARQARLWLIRNGITLATVDQTIAAIPDAMTRESVRVEWEYGTEVHRASQFVAQLGATLGLTSERLDAAFREAATL